MIKVAESTEKFDAYKLYTLLFNVMEMKVQHDAAVGDMFVVDHQHLTMAHVLNMTPVQIKKGAAVLEVSTNNFLPSKDRF